MGKERERENKKLVKYSPNTFLDFVNIELIFHSALRNRTTRAENIENDAAGIENFKTRKLTVARSNRDLYSVVEA